MSPGFQFIQIILFRFLCVYDRNGVVMCYATHTQSNSEDVVFCVE